MRSPQGAETEPGAMLDSIISSLEKINATQFYENLVIYFKEILIRLSKLSLEIHLTKITEGRLIPRERAILPTEDFSSLSFQSRDSGVLGNSFLISELICKLTPPCSVGADN